MKTHSTESNPGHDQRNQGFTLVELLLVLMILTLLAAIVYPPMSRHGKTARVSATKVQIKAIEQAVQLFELNTGHFPQGRDGLQELVTRPANLPNWNGPYMEQIPKDPWGNEYVYVYPGKHRVGSFDLMSHGEDGLASTGDGINNWQTPDAQAAAK